MSQRIVDHLEVVQVNEKKCRAFALLRQCLRDALQCALIIEQPGQRVGLSSQQSGFQCALMFLLLAVYGGDIGAGEQDHAGRLVVITVFQALAGIAAYGVKDAAIKGVQPVDA